MGKESSKGECKKRKEKTEGEKSMNHFPLK